MIFVQILVKGKGTSGVTLLLKRKNEASYILHQLGITYQVGREAELSS